MSNPKASMSTRGTTVEAAQAYITNALQTHLPNTDAIGTFSFGRRVATPSGRPMTVPRPCSAVASRSRGVSVGAEESRPSRELQLERILTARLPNNVIESIEQWLSRSQALLRKQSAASALRVVGPVADALASLPYHNLRQSWCAQFLHQTKHRFLYPRVATALPDIAQRGPLDRLATLLHAIAQFKLLVEAGKTPSVALPLHGGTRIQYLMADAAAALFSSNVTCAPGNSVLATEGDVVAGSNYNARHVSLAVGTHFYALEIFHPDGQPLYASEIKERILLAIDHANKTMHSQPFVGRLSGASCAPKKQWHIVSQCLEEACLANVMSIKVLNSSLFAVSLVSSAEAASNGGAQPFVLANPGSASWSGTSLQVTMLPNGRCTYHANGLFVDAATLAVFAQWTSSAANSDPMLSPPVPTSTAGSNDVVAVRRIPQSQLRPSTGGKAPIKASSIDADSNLEETSSIVNVTVAPPQRAARLEPLPLWLPIQHTPTIEGLDLSQPLGVLPFALLGRSKGQHEAAPTALINGVVELSVVVAVDRVLRVPGDELPPLVRYTNVTASSCPDEVLVFSDAIHNALKVLSVRHRAVESGAAMASHREAMLCALRSVPAAPNAPTTGAATSSSSLPRQGQILPMARHLSKRGFFPNRPTLRMRGESCAPADVTIFKAPVCSAVLGLDWLVETNVGGQDSARFSLSYEPSSTDPNEWSCTLAHRSGDAEAAGLLVAAIQAAARSIVSTSDL